MNLTNSNSDFQDFSKCNYNLHWSYSNFFRHINVIEHLKEDSIIIELGAGDSNYEKYAKENFHKNISIIKYDLNPEYDDIIYLDITTGIPQLDNSVDTVIFTEVIEHLSIDGAHKALSEIKRVLKVKGNLIISTPTPNKPLENRVYPADHHLEYSYDEFISIVSKYFRIDHIFPWAISQSRLHSELVNDSILSGVFTRLYGHIPDAMIKAILGIIVKPSLAKQVTITCTKLLEN